MPPVEWRATDGPDPRSGMIVRVFASLLIAKVKTGS